MMLTMDVLRQQKDWTPEDTITLELLQMKSKEICYKMIDGHSNVLSF